MIIYCFVGLLLMLLVRLPLTERQKMVSREKTLLLGIDTQILDPHDTLCYNKPL